MVIFSNFVGLPEGLKNRSRFLQVRCGVVRSVVSPGTIFHSSRPRMTRRWNCLSSFFPQERGSVPSWFAGSSWFRLDSSVCLRSSLFFGSGACLPSSLFFLSTWKGFCSIMICWFFLVPAGVLVLVSLLLSSLVPVLVSLLLSSWFCSIMICWFLLVPAGVPVLVSPSLFFGSGACLPSSLFFLSSGKGFCSIMICWFLLVPAGVPVLVSLLLSSFFSQEKASVPSWFTGSSWFRLGSGACLPSSLFFSGKGFCFIMDFLVPLRSGGGSGACLPSSLFFFSQEKGSVPWACAGAIVLKRKQLVPVLDTFEN